jgi:hypothetical protein
LRVGGTDKTPERAWFLGSGYCERACHHPHLHCAIPAGGLAPDHSRWIRPRYPFFLPVKVLSRVFRGKVVASLRRTFRRRQVIRPRRGMRNESKGFRGGYPRCVCVAAASASRANRLITDPQNEAAGHAGLDAPAALSASATRPPSTKTHSKHISADAASAANASGSLQTALSKVTRRSALTTPEVYLAASLPIEC